MKLFLVQHGDAVSKDIDPQRPLSERGQRDVEKIAVLLGQAGICAERVLHSGKPRAQQTALVLAKAVIVGGDCEPITGMAPNDPVDTFAKNLATWTEDTFLVGHLPFMSRLVSLLVVADQEREIVAYQPGSVVCLEQTQSGRWAVSWMVRPDLLAER